MAFRNFARVGLAATAIALSAATASAQVVTYSTSGTFTPGTFGSTTCTALQCTSGGFTLSFVGAPSTSYIASTLVDLGQFSTTYAPATGGNVGTVFGSGIGFVLTITQSTQGGGSNAFGDGIVGALFYNPSGSSLAWSPSAASVNIGPVNYALIRDNTNNIQIQAPTVTDNPNLTSVKANISVTPTSTVPEPSSLILSAAGLVGLALAARARRKA